jgi:NADP-dependent 3-hydroxy acid dehydrogenase YdfG
MEEIKEMNPTFEVVIVPLDLNDNTSVRQAAKTINSNIDFLDVLFNNAGVMAIKPTQSPQTDSKCISLRTT